MNAVFLHGPASRFEWGSSFHNKGMGFSPHTSCDASQCDFLGWFDASFENYNQRKKMPHWSSRILTGRLGQAPWRAALAPHLQWETWAGNVYKKHFHAKGCFGNHTRRVNLSGREIHFYGETPNDPSLLGLNCPKLTFGSKLKFMDLEAAALPRTVLLATL